MIPIGDDNSTNRRFPLITYALIAINIWVFFLEIDGGDAFVMKWSFIPSRFMANPDGDFLTIFTSMFMHAGWVHLAGNLLYLWIFGDNVEDRFGMLNFLIFYLLCGVAATFAQFAFSMESSVPNLGASGAIAGVLGAYMIMFPQARVDVLMGLFIIPMAAFLVIGLWFILQFFNGVASISETADQGGIAYLAHIGGFLAGFVLTDYFRPRRYARLRY